MSVQMVSEQEPVDEPAGQPVTEEADAEPRLDIRELLPTGSLLVLTAAGMVAAIVGSFAKFGFSAEGLVGAVFTPALVLLTVIDAKHRLLPNVIMFPTMLAVGAIVLVSDPRTFLGHFAIAIAIGGFFFAFSAFLPHALAQGDAKLVFLIGLALGGRILGALFISSLAMLVVALYLVFKHGPEARKMTIPIGPLLALGGLAAYFLA
jgi:prepilin signal peptidase PulO-like enzyme (type II secretory pathway)